MWQSYRQFTMQVDSASAQHLRSRWAHLGYHRLHINFAIEEELLSSKNKADLMTAYYLELIGFLSDYCTKHSTQQLLQYLQGRIVFKGAEPTQTDRASESISMFLTKLDAWSRESRDMQILVFLLCTGSASLIRCYLKLRKHMLNYARQNILFQYNPLSNHNLNKYSKKNYDILDSAKMQMDTWIVTAQHLLEGTEYRSSKNVEKVVEFLYSTINRKGIVNSQLKTEAVDLLVMLLYVFKHRQKLLEKKQQTEKKEDIVHKVHSNSVRVRGSLDSKNNNFRRARSRLNYSGLSMIDDPDFEKIQLTKSSSNNNPEIQVQSCTHRTRVDYSYKKSTYQPISYSFVKESPIKTNDNTPSRKSQTMQTINLTTFQMPSPRRLLQKTHIFQRKAC